MATTVNGEQVDEGLIEQEASAIKAHVESLGNVSCCERDEEFRQTARDNIIARVLLNQEAARRQLAVTPDEIDESLTKLEEEHGGREELLEKVGLQPCQIDLIRADIENGLRVEKTLRACVGEPIDPSEDQVRAFFQEHVSDYLTEEEIRVTHLFKQVPRIEERPRIYDELRALREQALAGADFMALALEHTDKEDKHIDLGWFKMHDFMEEFSLVVFSLRESEVSPVFLTYFGLHLCQCTGRRPAVPRPFDEVAASVRQRLIHEDQQEKSRQLVASLRAAATIVTDEEASAPATA
jgi:peptidyl-prolyl cis-trans isomerase C